MSLHIKESPAETSSPPTPSTAIESAVAEALPEIREPVREKAASSRDLGVRSFPIPNRRPAGSVEPAELGAEISRARLGDPDWSLIRTPVRFLVPEASSIVGLALVGIIRPTPKITPLPRSACRCVPPDPSSGDPDAIYRTAHRLFTAQRRLEPACFFLRKPPQARRPERFSRGGVPGAIREWSLAVRRPIAFR